MTPSSTGRASLASAHEFGLARCWCAHIGRHTRSWLHGAAEYKEVCHVTVLCMSCTDPTKDKSYVCCTVLYRTCVLVHILYEHRTFACQFLTFFSYLLGFLAQVGIMGEKRARAIHMDGWMEIGISL